MKQRWSLVAIPAAQLSLGVPGLRVALRDGVPADAPLLRRSRDRMSAVRRPDRERTPSLLGGFALAVVMVLLGFRMGNPR